MRVNPIQQLFQAIGEHFSRAIGAIADLFCPRDRAETAAASGGLCSLFDDPSTTRDSGDWLA
jgi:hypothetical protein